MRDLIRSMDIGNSVAEFDEHLQRYFVETETFRALIEGRADIIAGDKGTGKTALYRILQKRYPTIPELSSVEVIPGFNPAGNPVFQGLAQQGTLTEGQYIAVWKAYVLSLVGNWLLTLYETELTPAMKELDRLLVASSLRAADDTPVTVFSKISNAVARFLRPHSAGVEVTFSETGIPIITPQVEFSEEPRDAQPPDIVRHEDALALLCKALEEADLRVWVVLDRLDEAFQGFPDTEIPALRALLRTYLDLMEFPRISMKLFVRNDLFRKITKRGFVNLTHVNAKRVEIVWDEDDLQNLLCRRIAGNTQLMQRLDLEGKTDQEIFARIFPAQVDPGARRPSTWAWMMGRIRDGNLVKPPRNLVDLVIKAREAQLRREERSPRDATDNVPIIESDALRRALDRLSTERVEDTLLAEAGEAAALVEAFRGAKAEHNLHSLSQLLGLKDDALVEAVKALTELGFLEAIGESYKVPMLYRDGLGITQGKAF